MLPSRRKEKFKTRRHPSRMRGRERRMHPGAKRRMPIRARPNLIYIGEMDECPNCSSLIPKTSQRCPECKVEVNLMDF